MIIKKIFSILFLGVFLICCAQKNKKTAPAAITAETAEMSNDPQVIAKFVKANPDHPKTQALKSKLLQMILPKEDIEAKPKVEPLTKNKLAKDIKRDVKDGVNDKNKQAARVLNHLFSNDPNKSEAYIQIVNKSKCNLVVKFTGKQFYNLDVKAKSKNFILIDKGNYKMTTKVCDSQYDSSKIINKDITITLNAK